MISYMPAPGGLPPVLQLVGLLLCIKQFSNQTFILAPWGKF